MKLAVHIKNRLQTMRDTWHILSTNRIISIATLASLLCSAIGIICILFVWNKLPPTVPLWYSKPWGAERLAHPLWLFLLPAASLLITEINVYIAATLTSEYLVFSQILSLNSFIVSLLSIVTLLKTITMVL